MLAIPAAAHSVYVMWETGRTELRCWYVDLQEPLRRTTLGFDTMDHLLDIVISPDQSAWRWKDEDEFEEAVVLEHIHPKKLKRFAEKGNAESACCRQNSRHSMTAGRDGPRQQSGISPTCRKVGTE